MKLTVYAHFYNDETNQIQYRWRTLLQFGNSWDIIGTVYMKNPGSSAPIDCITDKENLCYLNGIDDTNNWFLFSVDPTMRLIASMMQEYMDYNHRSLEGIVQIFNLFNVRDADLEKAKHRLTKSICEKTFTIEEDIKHLVAPIYIGWGGLWREKTHEENARKIFSAVLEKMNPTYLNQSIEANCFYHPQYIMGIGKNKPQSIYIRQCFYQNTTTPQNIPFKNLPALDSYKIAKLFSEKTKLERYQNERYLLSNDIQVTVAHQGYVAIRHMNFNGKFKYSTGQYPKVTEIRSILAKYGYNLNSEVWLGTKNFSDYYENEKDIVDSIIFELKNISSEI